MVDGKPVSQIAVESVVLEGLVEWVAATGYPRSRPAAQVTGPTGHIIRSIAEGPHIVTALRRTDSEGMPVAIRLPSARQALANG